MESNVTLDEMHDYYLRAVRKLVERDFRSMSDKEWLEYHPSYRSVWTRRVTMYANNYRNGYIPDDKLKREVQRRAVLVDIYKNKGRDAAMLWKLANA